VAQDLPRNRLHGHFGPSCLDRSFGCGSAALGNPWLTSGRKIGEDHGFPGFHGYRATAYPTATCSFLHGGRLKKYPWHPSSTIRVLCCADRLKCEAAHATYGGRLSEVNTPNDQSLGSVRQSLRMRQSSFGHWGLVIHWSSGIGHWALGIGSKRSSLVLNSTAVGQPQAQAD